MSLPLDFGAEVARARREGRPVVALESSILAQGLPRPLNLDAARAAEAAVRKEGAAPATVVVIEGRLRVGLDGPALTALGHADGVAKLSRADLAACLATGGTGATTVAATMIVAHAAGIAGRARQGRDALAPFTAGGGDGGANAARQHRPRGKQRGPRGPDRARTARHSLAVTIARDVPRCSPLLGGLDPRACAEPGPSPNPSF